MLSLSSLLNPAPPAQPDRRPYPSPTISSPATSYSEPETVSSVDRPIFSRLRVRDSGRITKAARPRGMIHYHPFEEVDDVSMAQISRFRVIPFGRIRDSCAHIPYNSGKKDFFEKTGRESFEVFKYEFKVPDDDSEYTVMWDYNIGLVRMTPFFKCCQYGKTMPAKMLSMNPGLKDITHSITGGAILAQGYWMPYHCAKAVCATFCYKIAGALIPIFGPSFPSLCARPDSADYGRMTINPHIIAEATREAEANRHHYLSQHSPRSSAGASSSSHAPRGGRTPARSTPERDPYQVNRAAYQHQARLGLRAPRSLCNSPYNTDSDEGYARSVPDSAASSSGSPAGGYLYTSAPAQVRSSGWTPANQPVPATPVLREPCALGSQPWFSAVPRFAPPGADPRLRPWGGPGGKRHVDGGGSDCGYEGGAESQANSPSLGGSPQMSGPGHGVRRSGAEKKAALLLMNLSVKERAAGCDEGSEGLHRAKRRRASSM